MSQHINLLQVKRRPVGSALAALAVVAVLLLSLLVYGLVLHSQAKALRGQLDVSAQRLQETKTALVAMGARASANGAINADPSATQAEIAALQSKLLQHKKWGELVGNPSLGSPAGYLAHFQTLSGVSEEGLWLTSIFISDSGKLVNLTGRALRNESVLRYAEKLNQAFARQGVQFNAVEMAPETLIASGQEGAPALRSVSFRLF